MTDAYQNRVATAVPQLRYGAIGSGSFHESQLEFPTVNRSGGKGAHCRA